MIYTHHLCVLKSLTNVLRERWYVVNQRPAFNFYSKSFHSLPHFVFVCAVWDHGYVVLTCFVALCHFWFPRPLYKLSHKMPFFRGNCGKRNTCNSIQCSERRCQWHLYSSWNENAHLNRHFVYMGEAACGYAFPTRREAISWSMWMGTILALLACVFAQVLRGGGMG